MKLRFERSKSAPKAKTDNYKPKRRNGFYNKLTDTCGQQLERLPTPTEKERREMVRMKSKRDGLCEGKGLKTTWVSL